MEIQLASTPFGGRGMTRALLDMQERARRIPQQASVDKWKIHRWLCEAKTVFQINDRSLAVLSALLSFYPENNLSAQNGLVVFPSNKQLALRAHGMADATLRRHIAALIEAGLITRQDSPNGKRYARRTKEGGVQIAFGFSLSPLLVRADEIEQAAQRVNAEKTALRELRERVTLLRRDNAKLIEFALNEEMDGPWTELHIRLRQLVDAIPRRAEPEELARLAQALELLRADIDKALNNQQKVQNMSGYESQNERRHIESNPDSHLEKQDLQQTKTPVPSISLDQIMRICPDLEDYATYPIRNWSIFTETAQTVRHFLGVNDKLQELAMKTLGEHQTAILIAYILQRHAEIQSPAAYLRSFIEKARGGGFSLASLLTSAFHTRQKQTLSTVDAVCRI